MRRFTALFVLALLLIPTAVYAAEAESSGDHTIVREFPFVTTSEDFYFDAPQQVSESGRLYFRKDIRYECVGEEPVVDVEERTFTDETRLTGLSQKDENKFPAQIQIDQEGFIGAIPRKAVEWTEQAKDGGKKLYTAQVDLGNQVEAPTPANQREVVYQDPVTGVDTLTVFPLIEVRKTVDYRWLSNHVATLNLRTGDVMSIDDVSPAWQGKESQLLSLMRLDPQKYIIRSARWQGEALGGVRAVEFTMDRYAAGFVAIYEGEIKAADIVTYDGKAVYEGVLYKDVMVGTEYSVKAIVTYEAPEIATSTPDPTPSPEVTPQPLPETKPKSNPLPIAAAVAAPLLVGAAVFVFFWRKKQKESGGE